MHTMCGIALAICYVSQEDFIDRKLTNTVYCVFEAFLIVPLEQQNNKQKPRLGFAAADSHSMRT